MMNQDDEETINQSMEGKWWKKEGEHKKESLRETTGDSKEWI